MDCRCRHHCRARWPWFQQPAPPTSRLFTHFRLSVTSIGSKAMLWKNLRIDAESMQIWLHRFIVAALVLQNYKQKERSCVIHSQCSFSLEVKRSLICKQQFSIPPPPPSCIFCMSLLVNTPNSDNQLVRRALRAWTVFRLTCSLHRVHCFLLPEQGNPL